MCCVCAVQGERADARAVCDFAAGDCSSANDVAHPIMENDHASSFSQRSHSLDNFFLMLEGVAADSSVRVNMLERRKRALVEGGEGGTNSPVFEIMRFRGPGLL